MSETNPLLSILTTPGIPYENIKNSDYLPAIEHSITLANSDLSALLSAPAPEFTLSNFEKTTDLFDQIRIIYNNTRRINSLDTAGLEAEKINKAITDFTSSGYMNKTLFSKFESIDTSSFTPEERAVHAFHLRKFTENGMTSAAANHSLERGKQINDELANLISQYETNIIKDTANFTLHITNEDDMSEFTDNDKATARKTAQEKNFSEGYTFTLQAPSYVSVMRYCKNRDLRRKMYMMFNSKCLDTENTNRENIRNILRLRQEKAKGLGFKAYNDYVGSNRMAKSQANVYEFLTDLQEKIKPKATKEIDELFAFAKALTPGIDQLECWDITYYSEKYKKHLFGLSTADIRQYFPLSKVLSVLFNLVKTLYNITISPEPEIRLYHADCQVYSMKKNSVIIGYFYYDLYPRKEKTGGGWVYALKPKVINDIPIIGIIANNERPVSAGEDPGLTLDEVKTIFHECGHSLHIALSETGFKSVTGINVVWDFVEVPSQLMEGFIYETSVGEALGIPGETIAKIREMKTFNVGINLLRQINYSMIDMKIHDVAFDGSCDIAEFEAKEFVDVVRRPGKVSACAMFSHLFNATYDYSCGYYSYGWAEVIAVDGFEEFKNGDIGDVGVRFAKEVLSKGGSEDPNVLFERFKGRKFNSEAFGKEKGIG